MRRSALPSTRSSARTCSRTRKLSRQELEKLVAAWGDGEDDEDEENGEGGG